MKQKQKLFQVAFDPFIEDETWENKCRKRLVFYSLKCTMFLLDLRFKSHICHFFKIETNERYFDADNVSLLYSQVLETESFISPL